MLRFFLCGSMGANRRCWAVPAVQIWHSAPMWRQPWRRLGKGEFPGWKWWFIYYVYYLYVAYIYIPYIYTYVCVGDEPLCNWVIGKTRVFVPPISGISHVTSAGCSYSERWGIKHLGSKHCRNHGEFYQMQTCFQKVRWLLLISYTLW
jgi:hypothetical protein